MGPRLDDDHQEPCDPTLLNEMFRAAHSLKGLSAMLGLTDINNLTHKIENVFDAARKNELAVNGDVTELVFMGLDQLTALIDRLKEPGGEPVDCSAVRGRHPPAAADGGRGTEAVVAGRCREGHGSGSSVGAAGEPDRALSGDAELAPSPRHGSSPPAPALAAPDPLEDVRGRRARFRKSTFRSSSTRARRRWMSLTGALLALESGGNGDDLKGLMGTAHKIKGSAASIGLNRIAKLAHLMEDVLQELARRRTVRSRPAMTDVCLKCTDALQRHVAELKQGTAQLGPFRPTGARPAGGTSRRSRAAEHAAARRPMSAK